MPTYEIVAVRFNMDSKEKLIYEKLNKNNRAGHIKEVLKKVLIEDSQIDIKMIEDIVHNILSSQNNKKENVIEKINTSDLSKIARSFIKE